MKSEVHEPAVEPPPGNPKFAHLDGIRGVAALGILGYHSLAGNYTSITGWVQVGTALRAALPFFFLLSAFLLYRPFVAARAGDAPQPRLQRFWWRRIVRIVPAYWVALTLITICVGLPGVFGPDGWRYYAFVYVYSQHTVSGGLVPAWTLCVDMTFYLVLPLFAAAMAYVWKRFSLRTSVNIELGVLGMIWLISTAYWLVFISGNNLSVAGFEVREWNLLANLNWFVLGMALAVLSVSDHHRRSVLTRLLSKRHAVSIAWGAALLTFLIIARSYYETGEMTRHLLFSLMCVLIFAPAALVGWRGGIQRILAHPVLTWTGVTSYGIYLYHGPVINELRHLGIRIGSHGPVAYLSLILVTVPIALALSVASYYLLERPLLRLKNPRLHQRRPRPPDVLATAQGGERAG